MSRIAAISIAIAFIFAPWALLGGESKDGKEKKKEKETARSAKDPKAAEKKAPKPEAETKSGKKAAAAGNLAIPEELPEKVRKEIEEAVAAFQAAVKSETGMRMRVEKAIEKLKGAATRAPKSPIPLYYLGQAYQVKKNFSEAKRNLEKALKLNPEFFEAMVELGDIHMWKKDLKKAIETYDQALAIQPRYLPGIENKSFALIRLGRYEEAQPLVRQTLELDPNELRKLVAQRLDIQIKGPGWAQTFTHETENYSITTSISKEFAKEIGAHAELIRRAYNKVFADVEKPDRKYPIWVYADANSYHRAGNPPMAGGHYDPLFRKLVIFRYPKPEETWLVLYHEAFHQYLQDYLEIAPQWFNEGLADYFGAFQYVKKGSDERMMPRPNPLRLQAAKSIIAGSLCPPAAELMTMTREEMYNPRMAGIHYAQAWAMVYFMAEGPKTQYKNILVSYFKAIQKGQDLSEAYLSTFGKIDMNKFDKEWKGYIKGLGGS